MIRHETMLHDCRHVTMKQPVASLQTFNGIAVTSIAFIGLGSMMIIWCQILSHCLALIAVDLTE